MAHQDADKTDFSASENGRASTEPFASSARDEALSAAEKGLEAAREALAAAERKLAEAQRQAAYDRARQQAGQGPIDVDPVVCDESGAPVSPHGAQSQDAPQAFAQPTPDPTTAAAGSQPGAAQSAAWPTGSGTQPASGPAQAKPTPDPASQGGSASARQGGYNTSASFQQNAYQQNAYQQQAYGQRQPYVQPHYTAPVASRDHVAAGLLALFLGPFGVHKFYLGYNTQGFILLAISLLGGLFSFGLVTGVVWVISIVEGIIYLTKAQSEFERIYVYDKREWF